MLTKVLISVKTYPTLSAKYNELVCTAGFLDNGSWIRIYPLPFRALENEQKFNKWQWIELDIERNQSDTRPESYKVKDIDSLKVIRTIGTEQNWFRRKKFINKNTVYDDLSILIDNAHQNKLSLATFKPTKIIDFIVKEADRDWDQDKLDNLKAKSQQLSFFQSENEIKKEFDLVNKLPYKFSYKFEDMNGKQSTLMIEDWEVGALYWNCLKYSSGNEQQAIKEVKQKYFDTFTKECDILLFLGTTRQYHIWANNPFVIVGIFYPKKNLQPPLF